MEKQWFGFFAPGLGVKNAKRSKISSGLVGLVLFLPLLARGELSAEEVLNLPAFDIQWNEVTPKSEAKVGDALPLKIMGVRGAKSTEEFNLTVPPGAEDLADSGWGIESFVPSTQKSQTESQDFPFTAVPLKEGQLTLPALLVQDHAGKPIGRTRPFRLSVTSSIRADDPRPKEVAPPEPPVSLSFPWWVVTVLVVVGVSAFAGVCYFLYEYWKKHRVKVAKPMPIVVKPEDEEALAALTEVARAELIKKGAFKAYYFRISEILKGYVGRRYRCDALECTSAEMFRILENKNALDDALLDELEKTFDLLDRVKFTDFVPDTQECTQLLEWARSFVLRTRKPRQEILASSKVGATSPTLGSNPGMGGSR